MDLITTATEKLIFEFATALVEGEYQRAHELLSDSARDKWPPSLLRNSYQGMVGYFEAPPSFVAVEHVMNDWPDKKPTDIGWAYASIYSEDEGEGVTLVVCAEKERYTIREIEWGRP